VRQDTKLGTLPDAAGERLLRNGEPELGNLIARRHPALDRLCRHGARKDDHVTSVLVAGLWTSLHALRVRGRLADTQPDYQDDHE
jgi:hypothetical protein